MSRADVRSGSTPWAQLRWQDVDSESSRVRPLALRFDPLERLRRLPFAPAGSRDLARLRQLELLLELAYGYRASTAPETRPSRRSPSAGALYPTEVCVLARFADGARALHYSFETHRSYALECVAAAELESLCPAESDAVTLVFLSIFWRTLQRYGARGYRYCLLDAGHVAANTQYAARWRGHEVVATDPVPRQRVAQVLGLRDDEGVLLTLTLRLRDGAEPVAEPVEARVAVPGVALEEPPWISHALRRVQRMHADGLTAPRADARALSVMIPEDGLTLADWVADRRSAKDFSGGPAPVAQLLALESTLRAAQRTESSTYGGLEVHGIAVRVEGMAPQTYRLAPDGRETIARFAAPQLAERLFEGSQRQELLQRCAFAFALSVRSGELERARGAAFRQATLACGFLGAALYREAARIELGTTTIGNMADRAIGELLGNPGSIPLTLQACGPAVRTAAKRDRATQLDPTALHGGRQ